MKSVDAITSVLVAVVGVAIVAVLVSKNAQTATVVTDAGKAFSQIINAAVGPVTSGASTITS